MVLALDLRIRVPAREGSELVTPHCCHPATHGSGGGNKFLGRSIGLPIRPPGCVWRVAAVAGVKAQGLTIHELVLPGPARHFGGKVATDNRAGVGVRSVTQKRAISNQAGEWAWFRWG